MAIMAEEPVNKKVRKTTTKRVARKTAVSQSDLSQSYSNRRGGLSLKFVLMVILVLFLASGGAFYIGYSAEGAIDVNDRLANSPVVAGEGNNGVDSNPVPPPLKERPKLEPANVETPTAYPEPEIEGATTSTDESSESNESEAINDNSTFDEAGQDEISVDAVDTPEENPSQ